MSGTLHNNAPSRAYRAIPLAIFVALLIGAVGLFSVASHGQSGSSGTTEVTESDLAAKQAAGKPPTDEQEKQTQTSEPGLTSDDAPVQAEHASPTLASMLASGQVRSIRVIGDSLTAGYSVKNDREFSETGRIIYDASDETDYEPPLSTYSWATRFRTYAGDHGVEEFVNAGIGGSSMARLAANPAAWIGTGADVIVVMLGTNDIDYSTIDQYRADAETALSEVAANCNHMVVLSPPRNAGTLLPNVCELDEVDAVLTELCAEHEWEHISLYDVIDPQSDDVFPDHVHPTTVGAQKLWDAFRVRLGLPT